MTGRRLHRGPRRFHRWGHGGHRPHHRRDLRHYFFRWLVASSLGTAFVAAHVGFWIRAMGLGPLGFALSLLIGISGFWFASGRIARRLSSPMEKLTAQAQAIGAGDYSGRSTLTHHRVYEVRRLSETLNDMAARIEQQIRDQRELLAAISHELRSPLARMRVLLEVLREQPDTPHALSSIEEEVQICDRLIGTMLASARLEFGAADRISADASVLAERALLRADLPPSLLSSPSRAVSVTVDVTLLGQALANLLENAARHGGGVTGLSVEEEGEVVTFAVEDAGPGFHEGDHDRLFESFYRTSQGKTQGLGLGLSLVRRVALAHGGRSWAENRPGGGARVAFSIRRGGPRKSPE